MPVPAVEWGAFVQELGPGRTFQTALDTYDFTFVDFYAPWCEHCRRLKAELNVAAERLAALYPPTTAAGAAAGGTPAAPEAATPTVAASNMSIAVGRVDCIVHRSLCSEIDSVPKLWLFRNRKAPLVGVSRQHRFVEYVEPHAAHTTGTEHRDPTRVQKCAAAAAKKKKEKRALAHLRASA